MLSPLQEVLGYGGTSRLPSCNFCAETLCINFYFSEVQVYETLDEWQPTTKSCGMLCLVC